MIAWRSAAMLESEELEELDGILGNVRSDHLVGGKVKNSGKVGLRRGQG